MAKSKYKLKDKKRWLKWLAKILKWIGQSYDKKRKP